MSQIVQNLPDQIKKEFKRIFFDFVKSTEWQDIRAQMEIVPQDHSSATEGISYKDTGEVVGDFNNSTFVFDSNDWKGKWHDAATFGDSPSDNMRFEEPIKPVKNNRGRKPKKKSENEKIENKKKKKRGR